MLISAEGVKDESNSMLDIHEIIGLLRIIRLLDLFHED